MSKKHKSIWFGPSNEELLNAINGLYRLVNHWSGYMIKEMEALRAEVEANSSVDESAVVLLQSLAAQIEELKTDPAALQGLADKLKASTAALAAAVAANTPAAPEPAPEPAPQ